MTEYGAAAEDAAVTKGGGEMQPAGVVTAYAYNPLNQILSDGRISCIYGPNGGLQETSGKNADALPMRFTYDSRNNLTALYGGERLWQENQYNGLGCRTGMKGGEEMLACCVDYADEYRRILTEQGTQSRNYLWQDNTLLGMPGEEGYVLTDAFHTPVQVLDREGKLLNLYQYDEFGRLTKKRETYELPFGYTDYRKEAAQNLYFAGAREYNGESGRCGNRRS